MLADDIHKDFIISSQTLRMAFGDDQVRCNIEACKHVCLPFTLLRVITGSETGNSPVFCRIGRVWLKIFYRVEGCSMGRAWVVKIGPAQRIGTQSACRNQAFHIYCGTPGGMSLKGKNTNFH